MKARRGFYWDESINGAKDICYFRNKDIQIRGIDIITIRGKFKLSTTFLREKFEDTAFDVAKRLYKLAMYQSKMLIETAPHPEAKIRTMYFKHGTQEKLDDLCICFCIPETDTEYSLGPIELYIGKNVNELIFQWINLIDVILKHRETYTKDSAKPEAAV
jgi:hypothetical protein